MVVHHDHPWLEHQVSYYLMDLLDHEIQGVPLYHQADHLYFQMVPQNLKVVHLYHL